MEVDEDDDDEGAGPSGSGSAEAVDAHLQALDYSKLTQEQQVAQVGAGSAWKG